MKKGAEVNERHKFAVGDVTMIYTDVYVDALALSQGGGEVEALHHFVQTAGYISPIVLRLGMSNLNLTFTASDS